jgi:hypothetical protein
MISPSSGDASARRLAATAGRGAVRKATRGFRPAYNVLQTLRPTVDYREERDALENLIYLMGGSIRFSQPPRVEASEGPPLASRSSGGEIRRRTLR